MRALCRVDRSFALLYASLKAVHLLAVIVWLGGMFFMLACLRPAAAVLEPAARVTVMHAAMRRFFAIVTAAALLVLVTGAAMIGVAWSAALRAGVAFNMPLDWYAMVGIFFVMVAVFMHIRSAPFSRLSAAVAGGKWADGAAALASIRLAVTLNLVLGTFVVAFIRMGGTA